MFYTIYKITNQINGKFYIGSHRTSDLNDNYMGSGKYLTYAQNKYGIENFTKEILFVFDNPEEMYDKEAEIVNEEFLNNDDVYNLRKGGSGGFDFLIKSGMHRSNFYRNIPLSDEHIQKILITKRKNFESGVYDLARDIWSKNMTENNPMFLPENKKKVSE